MLSLPDGLIWLASFPKSGNTWMRILLSNLMAGEDAPQDINDLTLRSPIASGRFEFEYETLVDSRLLTDAEIETLRPAVHEAHARDLAGGGFAKTHDAFVRLADGRPLLGQGGRAALYLVRDPRDVAVSLAFHMNISLDEAIETLIRPDICLAGRGAKQIRIPLNGWSGHVQSWLDRCPAPVHVVRYEDLLADTLREFRLALDFLGAIYDADEAARAVRHARFSELQSQESTKGFRERTRDTSLFFRQGQAGNWKRHLSANQAHAIEQVHGPTMRRFGYLPSDQDART